MIEKNIQAWSLKNTVNFYVQERTCAADLYKSEAALLLPVIPHVRSVLDVGCAVGNFSRIIHELNPKIAYTGADTAEGMLAEARQRHPDAEFRLVNGSKLPFEDGSFDLAMCMGVLHHNPDYLDMIAEMVRVSRRFVVVDLPRLVTQPYTYDLSKSYMILQHRFPEASEGIVPESTKVPYVLGNVKDVFEGLLRRLSGSLAGMAGYGYHGNPHSSVTIPYWPVIFTVALLVKGQGPVRYYFDLPGDALPMAEAALALGKGRKVSSIEAVAFGDGA